MFKYKNCTKIVCYGVPIVKVLYAHCNVTSIVHIVDKYYVHFANMMYKHSRHIA